MKLFQLFRVVLIALTLCVVGTLGCTQQNRAKNWGGTATIDLPAGERLVTITWKDNTLWYLTRPRIEGEKSETYTFRESSSWGIKSGTVIVKEH